MFLSRRSNGAYYLWFEDDLGIRRKVSTKTRLKTDALRFLRDFKQEEYRRKARLQFLLLSEFIPTYLAHSRSIHTPKSSESCETALREFQRIIGDIPLHKVGVREIEQFVAKKKREASEWTARKYYLALASAFETAKRWGHVRANPFRQVPKPKTPELVPAYLTREDFAALLRATPDRDFQELMICAVSTGMRRGELLALRWGNVDLARRLITVTSSADFVTKNRRVRVIPLTQAASGVLTARMERSSIACDLVFHTELEPIPEDKLSKAFKAAVRRAKLSDKLHFHSLRHTFATWLVQAGVSLYEVQKLLGHSTLSTTQIYAHLAASELHGAVNKISLELPTTEKPVEVELSP